MWTTTKMMIWRTRTTSRRGAEAAEGVGRNPAPQGAWRSKKRAWPGPRPGGFRRVERLWSRRPGCRRLAFGRRRLQRLAVGPDQDEPRPAAERLQPNSVSFSDRVP